MKRGWTCLLSAAIVALAALPASAAVDVQLNLRYTDPANATGGGTWELLVKSSAANGLAGLSVNIGGNLGVTAANTPSNAITPNTSVFTNTDNVFVFAPLAGLTNIALGEDFAPNPAPPVVVGVGTATFPIASGRRQDDDLFANGVFTDFWDNSTLVASGSWTGARPTLTAANVQANEYNAGVTAGVQATIGTVSVRGDSLALGEIFAGDANRDGRVNINDFSLLNTNYGKPGTFAWGDGDFNSSTGGTNEVNINDFSLLNGVNYNGAPHGAVPFAAVPEPGSLTLLGLAAFGIRGFVRRSFLRRN